MLGFQDCSIGLRLLYALNYDHWCKPMVSKLCASEGGYSRDDESKLVLIEDMKVFVINPTGVDLRSLMMMMTLIESHATFVTRKTKC